MIKAQIQKPELNSFVEAIKMCHALNVRGYTEELVNL